MQAQLHNATAYNAGTEALKGQTLAVGSAKAAVIQFAAAGGYDGAVTVEISPDAGTTWFGIQAESLAAVGTYVSSITSFTSEYRVLVPANVDLRVRMSGGSTGSLTVDALTTAFAAGVAGFVAAPDAPTGLSATVISTSRIDLAWTDAATTETEYRVYRSTDGVNYSLIDTIAAGRTSYSDTTIAAGTTYYWKVGSYNAGGEALSSAVSANTLTLSLISYWKLEEASGTRDDTVGSNDLTPTNAPGNAAGKLGNAAAFVGSSSQRLTKTSNAGLQTGNIDFTVAAWVYPESVTGTQCIIAKTDEDTGNANGYEYMLYLNGNKISLLVANGAAGIQVLTSDATVSVNTWYYVEGYHDDAGTLGVAINTTVKTAARTTTPVANTTSLRFGGVPSKYYLTGRVDDAGFWKRLFTTNERTALYNSGNGFNSFLP